MSRSFLLFLSTLAACAPEPLHVDVPDPVLPDAEETSDDVGVSDDVEAAEEEALVLPPAVPTAGRVHGDTDPRLAFHAAAIEASGSAYSSAWSRWRDLGYVPVALSAENTSSGPRWNGLWHRDPSITAWTSRRGLTSAQYGDLWSSLAAEGWRVLDLDPYVVSGEVRWNGIWVKDSVAKPWASYRGLTASALAQRIASEKAAGRRPSKINGYRVGSTTYFSAVFVGDGLTDAKAETGLTAAQYGTRWSYWRDRGYRPADIAAYDDGGLKYAGVWVKDPSVAGWSSTRDMSTDGYRTKQRDMALAGYVQVDADLYRSGGSSGAVRHAGIWVRPEPRDALASDLPLTGPEADALRTRIASYDGTLGFYVVDLETGHWIGLNHHEPFYMASTSKVHVATAILRAVDDGDLALTDRWTFSASDHRQSGDPLNRSDIGSSYTVDQYLGWMINNSSTGATDKLVGWLGEGPLNDALIADGRVDVGEVTSICTLDKRIASRWNSCVTDVPCSVFEPYWRDGEWNTTWGSCLLGTKGHTASEWDAGYDAYYATLANSATPAGYVRFWEDLVAGDALEADTTARFLEILAATPKSYVDDGVVGLGYYDRMGGKHGGKRSSRSWVGVAWDDASSGDVADATPRYALALFAEDWDSDDDTLAKAALRDTLADTLAFLD